MSIYIYSHFYKTKNRHPYVTQKLKTHFSRNAVYKTRAPSS